MISARNTARQFSTIRQSKKLLRKKLYNRLPTNTGIREKLLLNSSPSPYFTRQKIIIRITTPKIRMSRIVNLSLIRKLPNSIRTFRKLSKLNSEAKVESAFTFQVFEKFDLLQPFLRVTQRFKCPHIPAAFSQHPIPGFNFSDHK